MDSCDVLIVGGGPAGSSCAWALQRAGLETILLDKRTFPREKLCGGWITPAVLDELEINHAEYERGRVFQPITGFRTGIMGRVEVETEYGKPVSYGIRRFEFDDFQLRRCGARIMEGAPLESLERSQDGWIANGEIKARMVIGAGGTFCPVARVLGADARQESAVVAQEIEFEMTGEQREGCAIRAEIPELYFCSDMKGYGWCFRKGNFLNVGLGRMDRSSLKRHVAEFLRFLKEAGKLAFDLPASMLGHAYLLYREIRRNIVADGVLLIGDSAGLAYSMSGEGIRPAIESGLLAAKTVVEANGRYGQEELEKYRASLISRFGNPEKHWSSSVGKYVRPELIAGAARTLLANSWFSRHVILDRWFLHLNEPALNFEMPRTIIPAVERSVGVGAGS